MRPLLPGRFRLALSQQLITIRGLSPVALGAKAPIFGPPVEDSKPSPDTKGPSEKERLPSETLLLCPIGHLPITPSAETFSQSPQPLTAFNFRLQPPHLLSLVHEPPQPNRRQSPQRPTFHRPARFPPGTGSQLPTLQLHQLL